MKCSMWTVVCVLVAIASQADLIGAAPSLGTCSPNDNGRSYYQKADNLCYNIYCDNGLEQLGNDHRCLSDNTCFPIGTSVNLNNCVIKTCQRTGNVIGFSFTKKACPFQNECLLPGTVKTSGCMKYQCVDKSRSEYSLALSLQSVDVGCVDKHGGCHPLGTTISDSPCIEQTCVQTDRKVFFNTTLTACRDADNNVCRSVGETWASACFVYKCVKIESASSITLQTDVLDQKC
ncbi:unnamed protein product [Lymnaea stagnalis]|uniref:Uncharacterized protein n=1 Tax=Lymnaea stagnalis TaxID=6523 RepID=A0AAV2IKB8_LYMST